eukprot:661303-Hanusia_phi.AAC.1
MYPNFGMVKHGYLGVGVGAVGVDNRVGDHLLEGLVQGVFWGGPGLPGPGDPRLRVESRRLRARPLDHSILATSPPTTSIKEIEKAELHRRGRRGGSAGAACDPQEGPDQGQTPSSPCLRVLLDTPCPRRSLSL